MRLSFAIKCSTTVAAVLTVILLSTPTVSAATLRSKNEANTDAKERNPNSEMADKFTSTNEEDIERELATRIVGGVQAQLGAYPYYTQWIGGCGGSLIHPDIVLTAAHCSSLSGNQVIVGAYQTRTTGNGAVAATIVQRVRHPLYNSNTEANDFLILKLGTSVPNAIVNLNSDNANPTAGEPLVVVGLGTTSSGGTSPTYLREATVNAVAHTTCNLQYSGDIDELSMLCAGVIGGGKDTCQGDSGGPMVEIVNGVHTLVGVTSWGIGCALPDYPGVYARVSGQIAWIEQQICALSANPPARCGGAVVPTSMPTPTPTLTPTVEVPTSMPTTRPTTMPTANPTSRPPTVRPTTRPTTRPTPKPTTGRRTPKPTR